jgi:DNA-binding HxlR family transcriptional regulator
VETRTREIQVTEVENCFPEATEFSECTRHLLPLMDTMDVLSGRWKFTILLALWFGGKMRFKELQRNVRGITGKVLSKELKSLEEHGILTRTVFDTAPISVVYELTEYGKTLDKVMVELREWGIQHRKKMIGK